MCGIVGIAAPAGGPLDPATITRMRSLVTHRGPDDRGFSSIDFKNGQIHANSAPEPATLQLGFTRLSIRDLSHSGHQPMLSDDGSTVILFNGEVYNTERLTSTYLEGVPLRSTSDTEIVLRLIQKLGLKQTALAIDGMFAIAMYDSSSRTLQLARDRFGIKPLYYANRGGKFVFASEIKPILASGIIPTEMDQDALSELAIFRYVADPLTPFKGVVSLPPGTTGTLNSDGVLKIEQYWSPAYVTKGNKPSVENPPEPQLVAELLKRSIRSQLVSDVQVGLELSGGIDSSLVAWAAQETGLEGYSAIPSSTAISEEPFIDHVASTTSTKTNKVSLTPDSIAKSIGAVAYHHETPINHEGSIGIYQVCELAKSHGVTVLLSGEGADELFAGYQRHRIMSNQLARAKFVSTWTSKISSWLPRRFKTANEIWRNRTDHLTMATAYGLPNIVGPIFPGISADTAIQRRRSHLSGFDWANQDENHLIYDQKTYLVDLLARQDKLSMAHSVETRVPFLANDVADLARKLSMNNKLGDSKQGKVLLKQIVASQFGDTHAYRKKWGFPLPYSYMAEHETIRQLAKSCAEGLVSDGITVATEDVFENALQGDGYADRVA
ncbi:MAG: asparagine synthase (glutamine-hydrolyzing), partial [Dehalococcoidia bacterium]